MASSNNSLGKERELPQFYDEYRCMYPDELDEHCLRLTTLPNIMTESLCDQYRVPEFGLK